MDLPTYFTSKKPNPCRIKQVFLAFQLRLTRQLCCLIYAVISPSLLGSSIHFLNESYSLFLCIFYERGPFFHSFYRGMLLQHAVHSFFKRCKRKVFQKRKVHHKGFYIFYIKHLSVFVCFKIHCVKSVQIWSFFWSVFFCTRTEYGDLRSKSHLHDSKTILRKSYRLNQVPLPHNLEVFWFVFDYRSHL